MATTDFNLCDICGEKVDKNRRMFVATGRQMDAAGSMETVGEHIDLCNRCAVLVIQYLIKKSGDPLSTGKVLVELVEPKGSR